MLRLKLSTEAQNDLIEITTNIIEFTGFFVSGMKFQERIYEYLELISAFPGMGRRRTDGTMETFCNGYRIVYKYNDEEVVVLAIIHSRRLYPRP